MSPISFTITRGIPPPDERFGLTNQMRRAAVSISSNIAEGTPRMSQTDFARFIEIATGSVFEVVSQAFIGQRQGFLNGESFRVLYSAGDEIGRMLSGLRKSFGFSLMPGAWLRNYQLSPIN